MYVSASFGEKQESCEHYCKGQQRRDKRLFKYGERIKVALWTCSSALVAERIICSYDTFSPITVTEVWLENVKSGLVQLKSSRLRSLLILISGIGCLNRLTNYILSSLIHSLPFFFSCSLSCSHSPQHSLPVSAPLSLSLIISNEMRNVHWIFE